MKAVLSRPERPNPCKAALRASSVPSRITCEGDCEVAYAKTKRGKRLFWVAWMGFTLVIVLVYVSLAKASPL